jgi:hypothetical protein
MTDPPTDNRRGDKNDNNRRRIAHDHGHLGCCDEIKIHDVCCNAVSVFAIHSDTTIENFSKNSKNRYPEKAPANRTSE